MRNYEVIERCVLATMLGSVVESLQRQGMTLRADVLKYLNTAAAAPLGALRPAEVGVHARHAVDMSDALLKSINEDDLRTVLLIVCLFIEKLVDEGLFVDVQNQAVLIAMLIVTEAKEDEGAGWPALQDRLMMRASNLVCRAQLLGYFTQLTMKPILH